MQAITKDEPIPFHDGPADFTKWATLFVNFRPGELTGVSAKDYNQVLQALKDTDNPAIQSAGPH